MIFEHMARMKNGKGFIAALDQSGGSTPRALELYGISQADYSTEEEMYDRIHEMRTRIMTNTAFRSEYLLGAILFEQTMERTIEGMATGEYLLKIKGIFPFLKVDKGLETEKDGVQLMKAMPQLDVLLKRCHEKSIIGTKMRSVIKQAHPQGIKKIVEQQFQIGKQIMAAGLLPILEPEVDIYCSEKEKAEALLEQELLGALAELKADEKVILKLTLPEKQDFYGELIQHPQVLRVVALSGGYSRDKANEILSKNKGLIASFSRALTEGLSVQQSDTVFTEQLNQSVQSIYEASIT